MQALALKGQLEKMGHTVLILDRRHNLSYSKRYINYLITFLRSNILNKPDPLGMFCNKAFKRTPKIYSHKQLVKQIRNNKLDAVVIGSDQVWNAGFCKLRDLDYWGEFNEECNVKILSYAASMGVPEWNYDPLITKKIVSLLKKFRGISVRETHLIPILSQIGINNAKWVLDPTLLHSRKFYDQYIIQSVDIDSPYVFIYWLGDESLIPAIPQEYSKLPVVKCNLSSPTDNLSLEEWVTRIAKAKIVITNSFHGCAMSCLFEKHFIPFVHPNYIEARLITLFSKLSLKSKLTDPYSVESYPLINEALDRYRKESIDFLNESLN